MTIFNTSSLEECNLPRTDSCINTRLQLNIRSLNAMTIPDGTRKMEPDYYITLTISRDKTASVDDLSFTCTSEQNKV